LSEVNVHVVDGETFSFSSSSNPIQTIKNTIFLSAILNFRKRALSLDQLNNFVIKPRN